MSTTTTAGPALKVEFSIEARTEVRVDLVKFFTNLDAANRVGYWELDLEGCEEWERPRCYIHEYLRETTGGLEVQRAPGLTDEGMDDFEVDDIGRAKREEYDALLAAVSWMDPEWKPTEEDISRLPGPNDRPLFDLGENW